MHPPVTWTDLTFQGFSLQVVAWLIRREAPKCQHDSKKKKKKRGGLGCSTLWRAHRIWTPPPKPVSLHAPPWAQIDTLPQKKDAWRGPGQAVVSPVVTGHLRTAELWTRYPE